MTNSFIKGLVHGIATFVLFAVPFVVNQHGGWLDITIGSILTGLYQSALNYLQS